MPLRRLCPFALLCLLMPGFVFGQLYVRRSDQILKVDPLSGAQSPVFSAPAGERIGDLIRHGSNALLTVLWQYDFPDPEDDPLFRWRIVSVDPATGTGTTIYTDALLSNGVPSITVGMDQLIYAGGYDSVLQINPVTGFARAVNSTPLELSIWGILAEPSGTLLFAVDYLLFRLDPITGLATPFTAFDSDISWINVADVAPDGAIYLAADNERIWELKPGGALRVVTEGGYLGVIDDGGNRRRNSAAVGLIWLNATQLIATVSHVVDNPFFGIEISRESRVIWVDITTGAQHLISEGSYFSQASSPLYSGLAVLGDTLPRTAAPLLSLTRGAEDVSFPLQLTWSAPGFVLESSSDLGNRNSWMAVDNAPTAYSGFAQLPIDRTNQHRFYRLSSDP